MINIGSPFYPMHSDQTNMPKKLLICQSNFLKLTIRLPWANKEDISDKLYWMNQNQYGCINVQPPAK